MRHRFSARSTLGRLFALLLSLLFIFGLFACEEAPKGAESTAPETTEALTEAETLPPIPKKRVALTYDDGPQYYEDRTKSIVDELSKYGYTATFFVVGNRIPGGNALSYAVERGCEVGIHGYTHTFYYDTCTDAQYENEINKTATAIEKAIPGYKVRLMRPVGGRISDARLAASPYSVILWNVDSADWEYKYKSGDTAAAAAEKVNTIVENVMSSVSDGSVILMHDIYESTYDATVELLKRLHEEGYEVVSVSELFGDTLAPGQKYTRLG